MTRLKVDRTTADPIFKQIAAQLRGQIQAGQLRNGELIPPERELAASLGISRMTLRAAVDGLVREGLLVRQSRRGTVVSAVRVRKTASIEGFMSFSEEMRLRGLKPSSRVMTFSDQIADPATAAQLGLPVGAHVIDLTRVRLANGEPMAIERSHLPYARFSRLLRFDLARDSLYDLLAREFGTRPSTCEETIEAILLASSDAEALGVTVGDPALMVSRVTRDERGSVIEVERTIFRADRYRMVFFRRR